MTLGLLNLTQVKKYLLENGDEVWLDAPMYEEEVEELLFKGQTPRKKC